jgi:hypothetical protein
MPTAHHRENNHWFIANSQAWQASGKLAGVRVTKPDKLPASRFVSTWEDNKVYFVVADLIFVRQMGITMPSRSHLVCLSVVCNWYTSLWLFWFGLYKQSLRNQQYNTTGQDRKITHDKPMPPIEVSRRFICSYLQSLKNTKGKACSWWLKHWELAIQSVNVPWVKRPKGMLKLNIDGTFLI